MPELPEVESTVTFLRERISNQRIEAVQVLWDRTIARIPAAAFIKRLQGATITGVRRRAKFVVLDLAQNGTAFSVFCHMRMTGSFDVLSSKVGLEKHDRVIVALNSGRQIRFHDPRKFGKWYVVDNEQEFAAELGPEPLASDFAPETLRALLNRRRGLKSLLLDQRLIAGLGNIYVDEALWHAKLHPLTPGTSISSADATMLHKAIQSILRKAIAAMGTDFGDGVVEMGAYKPQVYGRTGKSCLRCGSTIKRLVVGQRGTHVCGRCQRRRSV